MRFDDAWNVYPVPLPNYRPGNERIETLPWRPERPDPSYAEATRYALSALKNPKPVQRPTHGSPSFSPDKIMRTLMRAYRNMGR